MILQETNGVLKTVPRIEFATEKELQTLVERNLEEIFGCRLVATEFSTGSVHSGRIDSLALSEDGNPVIIEYKKVENSNLVTQGLFYLDWLKDHKGDFQIAVQRNLGDVEINWSNIRVICIAPSFDRYSLHAVNHMGVGLELWQYHRYANGVLEIEEIFRGSDQAKKSKQPGSFSSSSKNDQDQPSYSFEQHVAKTSDSLRAIASDLDEFIRGLNPSVVCVPQKHYIAYKFAKNIACMEVLGKKIKVWVPLAYRPDMPDFTKDVSSIGHYGTGDLEILVSSTSELDSAFALIREAYLKVGGD